MYIVSFFSMPYDWKGKKTVKHLITLFQNCFSITLIQKKFGGKFLTWYNNRKKNFFLKNRKINSPPSLKLWNLKWLNSAQKVFPLIFWILTFRFQIIRNHVNYASSINALLYISSTSLYSPKMQLSILIQNITTIKKTPFVLNLKFFSG